MRIEETAPHAALPEKLSNRGDVHSATTERLPSRQRHWGRTLMHWVRRTHLYLGLFLLPWAVLYGVTGFLFNHPMVLSDQKSQSFSQSDWNGTPLSSSLDPATIAHQVVEALKKRSSAATDYALIEPEKATFVRELASATVKTDDRKMTIFLDVLGRGGIVYTSFAKDPVLERSSFAVGQAKPARQESKGKSEEKPGSNEKLVIDTSLPEIYKQAIPKLLAKLGYPSGDVSVGLIPDLTFLMHADNKKWVVNYNALSGTVSGRPLETPVEGLSMRRFLTRLHQVHGYTYSLGARWVWAVFVDLMSGVMVFWGISGVFMWWQIKMTRTLGWLTLLVSTLIAALLTVGMWQVLSAG